MHRVISIRKQGWNWISNQEDLNCVDVDEIVNVRKQKQSVDKQSQDFLKSAHILDADEVPSLIKQEFGGQSLNSSSTHHMSSDVDYVKGVVAAMIMSSGFFSKPEYGSCAYTGIPIRREYSSNVGMS